MQERKHVNVLINGPGVDWLDRLAGETAMTTDTVTATRSDVIRAALRVARRHESEVRADLMERL